MPHTFLPVLRILTGAARQPLVSVILSRSIASDALAEQPHSQLFCPDVCSLAIFLSWRRNGLADFDEI